MQTLYFNSGECAVAFAKIGEIIASFCLSKAEMLAFEDKKSQVKRQEFLYARFASKVALTMLDGDPNISIKSYCMKFDEISILNDDDGKPYIVDNADYSLSITHSHGIVVSTVFPSSDNYGIDIEFIDEKHKATLKKIFPKIDDINELTKFWCLKEAAYKCGLRSNFNAVLIENKQTFPEVRSLKKIIQYYSGFNETNIDTYEISNRGNGITLQSGNLVFAIVKF